MAKITGRDKRVAEWLEKIGIDTKMTRRVVIDIPANGIIQIYLEQYGDSSIFEIEPPPELATAIRVEPAKDSLEEALQIIKEINRDEKLYNLADYDPTDYDPDKLRQYIRQWKQPND